MLEVVLFFGGQSSEHEVSIVSAANIAENIDGTRFNLKPYYITKDNGIVAMDKLTLATLNNNPERALDQRNPQAIKNIADYIAGGDVVFPMIHGNLGEDGSIQGLCRVLGVPFVGSSVLSSALCMDKQYAKQIVSDASIDAGRWVVFYRNEKIKPYSEIRELLGDKVVVKAANQGSSVGVNIAENAAEYEKAVADSFRYDNKIVVEEYVNGEELECGVIGNSAGEVEASEIGKIIVPQDRFYSYERKYKDDRVRLEIPAKIQPADRERLRSTACKAYKLLECDGYARVDFFLTEQGRIVFGEINTIPGFTSRSMFPLLFGVVGLSYAELLTRLIDLAIERHEQEMKIQRTHL